MDNYNIFKIFFLLILSFSCGRKEKPSPLIKIEDNIGSTSISIEYSSPKVRERKIWGELVPYNEIWRTGANDATKIKINNDVLINDSELKKGEYSLFTFPNQNKWIVIFNSVSNQWGSYDYDENMDVLRIEVIPVLSNNFFENLTFKINNDGLLFNWEYLSFNLSIKEL